MKEAQWKVVGALALGASAMLLGQMAQAAPFTYTNRDLMLCFRQVVGPDIINSYDFEVDIGQVSVYKNAAPGTTITITQYSPAQLNTVFGGDIDEMSWSVCGYVDPTDTLSPALPPDTLWLTSPRGDPTVGATPWGRESRNNQAQVASPILSILNGAQFYSSTVAPNVTYNTNASVRIPIGDGFEFGAFLGPNGDFEASFQGDVENLTEYGFTGSGTVSRSDLYELQPTTSRAQDGTPGTYLGYFEFRSDGSMVFVAGTSPAPPAPTLTFSRVGKTNTVSFPTTAGYTYSLCYTNAAGLKAPRSTWPVSPTTVTGDGTQHSIKDTPTDSTRFYAIVVQ